jgi:CubicO group peptidase (beta-lactamase class C family)
MAKSAKNRPSYVMVSAIGIALTLTLLLGGCGQPVATPTTEADPSDPVQERIQRVENGLIAVTAEGGLDLGDPKTLAERMEHYGVPGVGIAVINDYQLEWAKGYGVGAPPASCGCTLRRGRGPSS